MTDVPSAVPAVDSLGYAGRRVLVLGATGFIGRRLVPLLESVGASVCAASRSGDEVGSRLTAIARFDALDPGQLQTLVDEIRPSITFNLVSYGVRPGQDDPTLMAEANAGLPPRIAEALAAEFDPTWGGHALVHAGTQAEYGPVTDAGEEGELTPTTPYGETKASGTRALLECAHEHAVPTVVGRIFNVYGPGEPAHRLLPTLIDRAGGEGAIELTDAQQWRDFAYVDDVAEGLLRLGAATPRFEAVNLATGRPIQLRHFIETAADILGIPIERLAFGARPSRPSEAELRRVPTQRLLEMTQWSPRTALEDGIKRTAEFAASRP